MFPVLNAAEPAKLALQTALMLAEANWVVGMRMMGMAGRWRVTPMENHRMLHEKFAAATESVIAAGQAMAAGKSPSHIASAALKPVQDLLKQHPDLCAAPPPNRREGASP